MAKFSIIDVSTGEVKYSGTPRYNGTYCKVSYLEFTEIASDAPIEWNVGDYVVYSRTGLTYKLYDIPQPKKRSYKYEYGGAFVYQNVQFFPDTKQLEIEPFRDLVPADNQIHFTTQASWSVWTNAANLVDRFNAVMNTAYPNKWEFRLVTATVGSDLYKLLHDTWFDFTISGENVLQGLTKLYALCGNIGWVHSVENGKNIITVGIPPIYNPGIGTITDLYKYGIGHGLTEIRKSTTNRNELKTRLFAYGSTRNMIPRYYNNLTPAIKDAGSVYIPNLMLPLSQWRTTDGQKDASKAYIEHNVALYGLRPETVYFDGSNGQKEIYPSLEETTIGELYDAMASGAAYRPNLTKHGRSVRLDEVEAVSGIVDDGQRSQDGEKYQTSATLNIPLVTEFWTTGKDKDLDLHLASFTALYSGSLDLHFSALSPTITDASSSITSKSLFLRVSVGAQSFDTRIGTEKNGSTYSLRVPDVSVQCNADDVISVSIIGVVGSGTESGSTIVFYSPAATADANYRPSKQTAFVITIPQIGFDISTRTALGSAGLATIAMKDGKCGGRSFVVKSCKYNSTLDSWELTLYRGVDESLNTLFPNTIYPISVGDHFVLLDIAMPDTYIGMAELKLFDAANALLNDISAPKPFYEPMVDAKYMIDNNRTLLEGQYMQIADVDITDGSEYVLIDTLVISENESNIPTYKVTLREQKKVEYNNSQSSGSGLTSLADSTDTPTAGGLTPAQKEILTNLDSWFGKDANGNIFVKKDGNGNARNFYAFGEITAGGVGSGGGGGTSGITRIVVGTTPYEPTGGSTIVTLPDYYNKTQTDFLLNGKQASLGLGSNGQVLKTVNGAIVWANETQGTVTQIKVGTTPYDPVSGVVSIPAYPTTLPASDVYSWAKAASKPSYSYGEISGTPDLSVYVPTTRKVNGHALSADVTVTKNDVGLGSVENTALSTWAGTSNITTLGTITTGVWHGTAIANSYLANSKITIAGNDVSLGGSITANTIVGAATSAATFAGTAAKATVLATARNIWGQSFDGSASISGDMSSVGKMTFTAKTSASTSGNILEVVTLNGVTYLHTTLPFYSDSEITAGGVGSGGGGGVTYLYQLEDVPDYRTSYRGKYLRAKADGSGVEWVDVTGGVSSVINLTGNISQSQLRTALGLGSLAYLNGLAKGDVGLGNVDNTADANKSVSDAEYIRYRDTRSDNPVPYSTDFCKGIEYALKSNSADGLSQGGNFHGVMTLHQWSDASVGDAWQLGFTANGRIYARHGTGSWSEWSGLALTSDIPTDNSQLANGAGYITSSGSCSYATSAGNAGTLENHSASYFATASSLGDYLPLGGGTMTGSIKLTTITANDNRNQITTPLTHAHWRFDSALLANTPGIFPTINNANAMLSFDRYYTSATVFNTQIGFNTTDIYFRSFNGSEPDTTTSWNTIYHSGNSNKSNVAWEASSLTLHGAISGATSILASGDISCDTLTASNYIYPDRYGLYQSISNWRVATLERIGSIGSAAGGSLLLYGGNGVILSTAFNTDANCLYINTSGNVGIGTTSPSEKLYIAGNVLATGEVTAGSDSRWKDNQTPVTNGIDIIRQLRPMTWTWNSQFADKNYIGKQSAGLIAQQVAGVLPFAVRGNQGDGFTLDYNVFHAYEISAIQHHETEIDRLRKRVAYLENQLQLLKS